METILAILLMLHILGTSIFGKFESETAWWRLTLKWVVILTLAYSLYFYFGTAVTLLVIFFLVLASVTFHVVWCNRNEIHPLKATPRKRYYELRKWKWVE